MGKGGDPGLARREALWAIKALRDEPLRREVPDLSDPTLGTSRVERDGEGPTSVVTVHRGDCRVVVNLSGEATTIDADRVIAAWHIVDERPADGGGVRVVIPADGVAIVR